MAYTVNQITKQVEGKLLQSIDDRTINHFSFNSRSLKNGPDTIFFALHGNNRNGHDYIEDVLKQGVKTIVVDQSVSFENANIIKVNNTLKAFQLLAKRHRAKFKIPIIGITGSHGKTIVKEWLYQLLNKDYKICRTPKSYNSQIGVPLSILQLNDSHTLGIFEAGISKPGEMDALVAIINPSIGLFTGIGQAHQSNFKTLEQKEEEKRKLFAQADVVLNNEASKNKYHIPFTDKASTENCYCCINVMEVLGYEQQEIEERLKILSPLALRMEMSEGKNNCIILNDSYNISIPSLEIALNHLNEQANHLNKTVIISDVPDHDYKTDELEQLFTSQNINRVISVGNQTFDLPKIEQSHYTSTAEAIKGITKNSFSNEAILIKGSRDFRLERITQLLEEKKHQTVLTVNLSQLERNLKHYREKLSPKTKLMVMVKAFAYGTGSTEIPKVLEQQKVDYLGVAYADEGIKLRENGISLPIMVMNPEPSSFDQIIENKLEPEIYSIELLDEFIRSLLLEGKTDYPIHLKIDTGMNRLGFKEDDLPQLISLVKAQPEVHVKTMFSHLSSADSDKEDDFTRTQLASFENISNSIISQLNYSIDRHILNTAGIEKFPQAQYNMVRLGIGLYGINAAINEAEIKPIASLQSTIIQIKSVKKGESVGYGRQFIAPKDMTIGVVPIGYADGIRRSLGNGTFSFIMNEKKLPIIGNVCMDLTMIDLSNTNATAGDALEIFGTTNTIELLAEKMDTIPYEVLTSISQRVKRVFIRQ